MYSHCASGLDVLLRAQVVSYVSLASASLWGDPQITAIDGSVRALAERKEAVDKASTRGASVAIADVEFQMRDLGARAPPPGETQVRDK